MSDKESIIYGIHSVYEAISTDSDRISRVVVLIGNARANLKEIINIARKNRVHVYMAGNRRDFEIEIKKYSSPDICHQNVFAVTRPYMYCSREELIEESKSTESSLVLVLSHITDVTNFGAIIRSAVAFGVSFIVIPENRSVEVTGACYKASSGTVMKSRIVRVKNLASIIKKLKEYDYWVYAADSNASKVISEIDFARKSVLVLGSEAKGAGHAVLKVVDDSFKIPMKGSIDSLNVSVSAGICLYHISKC